MSVDHGQTVEFKIDTNTADYRVDIYRLGWYQGLGARKVATVNPLSNQPQNQPDPLFDPATNLVDAGNWKVSAKWDVPVNAVSGVYAANLIREDGVYGESQIIFVVRDDEGQSELLFQTSDTTWQAYNNWGGYSLYSPNYPAGRARAVSYNRPFVTRDVNYADYYFGEDFAMTRFLERNGYDVSYSTGIDTAARGSELLEHQVFISVGHDEYWSGDQRANVEAARDAGVNLAFFSGNEIYWKTRWEDSIDVSATPFRTMVVYKETLDGAQTDPSGIWTGTWRDPRFVDESDNVHPENALTGTIFTANQIKKGSTNYAVSIDVPAEFAALRFWRNTDVANLTGNQVQVVGDNVLGYEFDEDLDNGYRPAGLIPLSSTTLQIYQKLLDYGATFGPGTVTHAMTMYRADSGALVFGAGTVQYVWGLDSGHDGVNAATDRNLQQATVNLFADMGVQPGSLMAGLVYTTASTDLLAPISTITSPTSSAVLPSDSEVTIRGTAQDIGGGVVAVVEVSVDGGLSWHRATGRESWTYTFTTRGSGEFTILSRAVDDSGNIETDGPQVNVNPVQNAGVYSLWNSAATPSVVDAGEGSALELGVRFMSDVNGTITGLRFYKSAANTGTHTAHLWTNTGQLLATATFTNESASGWQQADFDTPVEISAGTTYVASYFAPNGHFSVDRGYFSTQGISNGPLHASPEGPLGTNGVFRYGSSSAFPTQSYQNSNYWVDVVLNTVVLEDLSAPTVAEFTPATDSSNVAVNSVVAVTFSEEVDPATTTANTIKLLDGNNNLVPTTLSYNAATLTVTLTPGAVLAYSTTYTIVVAGGLSGVKDLVGNPFDQTIESAFTTVAAPAPDTTPPTVTSTSPANGASNVAISTSATIAFSEALERGHGQHQHDPFAGRCNAGGHQRELQCRQPHCHDYTEYGAGQLEDVHDLDSRRSQRREGRGGQRPGPSLLVNLYDDRRDSSVVKPVAEYCHSWHHRLGRSECD